MSKEMRGMMMRAKGYVPATTVANDELDRLRAIESTAKAVIAFDGNEDFDEALESLRRALEGK